MARRGFSLVEMLVVIGIIAILAAMLFPVLARARARARQATCTSNMRQLATAFELYLVDWDDTYPGATNGMSGSGTYGGWVWYAQFGTPTEGYYDLARGSLFPYVKNEQVYSCPDDPIRSGLSYELNGFLRWRPMAVVTSPAETLLLIPEDDHGTANDGYFDVPAGDWPCRNHNEGVNLAHTDGHVKWRNWVREQVHEACAVSR